MIARSSSAVGSSGENSQLRDSVYLENLRGYNSVNLNNSFSFNAATVFNLSEVAGIHIKKIGQDLEVITEIANLTFRR